MSRKDVFGKAIRDVSEGKRAIMTIRRDDGYVHDADAGIYFTTFSEFSEIEKEAMSLAHGLVLDVGCGAGRHALYLQSKGLGIVGIDVSPLTIRVAHKQGLRATVLCAAPWIPFNNESFDTIILMFNNFGICGGYEETTALLVELNRLLRASGIILTSSLHATETQKVEHLRYHEANRKKGLSPGLVTIRVEYNGEEGDWFRLLLASPEEMKSLSEKVGLKLVRTIKQADNASYIGVIGKEKQQV
nr:class I SAM-dependent methyltransferase [Candidatus Njordarchaeota archaeon]